MYQPDSAVQYTGGIRPSEALLPPACGNMPSHRRSLIVGAVPGVYSGQSEGVSLVRGFVSAGIIAGVDCGVVTSRIYIPSEYLMFGDNGLRFTCRYGA